MTESGQRLETVRISNDPEYLREVMTRAGEAPEVSERAVAEAASRLLAGRGLRRVVNATGVVLHTNLGRSVLSERAALAAYDAATGYSNLEYDLERGARGSRYSHCVGLLRELTGAQACSRGDELFIAARVIESRLGVDDETNRPRRDPPDRDG